MVELETVELVLVFFEEHRPGVRVVAGLYILPLVVETVREKGEEVNEVFAGVPESPTFSPSRKDWKDASSTLL